MLRRDFVLGTAAGIGLAGCSGSKFKSYDGPPVTWIVVNKGDRRMYLLNEDTILRKYRIGLGFQPQGDKFIEGDGKTPHDHRQSSRSSAD